MKNEKLNERVFKPGDRVVYTNEYYLSGEDGLSWGGDYGHMMNATGTVAIHHGTSTVDVKWDDPAIKPAGVYPGNVQLIEEVNAVEEYQTILQEAQGLVYGNRNADYGHPYDDYVKNAAFLTQILKDKLKDDAEITPQDCILFMIMLKVSRLINDHTKRDSIVDVAGYAECLSRVNRREAGLE